jgi:hypothetical protein
VPLRSVLAAMVVGESNNTPYPNFMSVDLSKQHALLIRSIVICDLPGSVIFFYVI